MACARYRCACRASSGGAGHSVRATPRRSTSGPKLGALWRQGVGARRLAVGATAAAYRAVPQRGGDPSSTLQSRVPGTAGPAPRMPAPRRRDPLRFVAFVTVIVALAALAGLVITGLSSGPSNVAYQNDDYQVPPPDKSPPPIPVPQTYDEAEQLITKNAFYAQNVPAPVRCNSEPINVTTASDAQLKSHFEGLMECLVRVWQPPVTNAGWIIVRPAVTIYGEEVTTKCGRSGINAFYCSADQQVYYSDLLPQALPTVKRNKWTADIVMAHEFGHALQARTAILISAHALGQESNSKGAELEYMRRLETQADCFSGMFLKAISDSIGVQQVGPGRDLSDLRRHRG